MTLKTLDAALVRKVGKDICLRSRCYPVEEGPDGILFAAQNPWDELLREALTVRLGTTIVLHSVEASLLDSQLQRLSGKLEGSDEGDLLSDLEASELALSEDSSLEEIKQKSQSEPVIKLVHNLINQAIAERATDIHLEPSEGYVKVRYRKDGMLRDSIQLPGWVRASLTSCIKILAELDISEKRLPQDGRIKWEYDNDLIDMRVSTLPTRLGEKVVLRILKHVEYISTLVSIGMPEMILEHIRHSIHRPQGMLFVTGPTGSGKSSTLYACLREILRKEINVSTIEDPIEYRLDGANQVQVHERAGLSFSHALRSLLRQDPDVILVGEIRDEETAQIAVQASQTGHLVFSTLHTNNAASAITRLLDLGIKPFLIGSAVLGILAQRLIRKLCVHCRTMTPPTEDQRLFLDGLPELCPTAVGCEHCNGTGYQGRTGIFEYLPFDTQVREAILKGRSEAEIAALAGLRPLVADGVDKLKSGITSADELMRVAVTEKPL